MSYDIISNRGYNLYYCGGKTLLKINKNFIIILFLAAITFLYTSILFGSNQLALTSDSSFHFSRVEEIYHNLRGHHLLTFIASYTFNHTGVGNFLFYPTVFLYPWAFLRFYFNPISAFFIWYGLFLFITLTIAYYSMYSFSKNRGRSLIFALIYTIAPYHLHLGLYNYVLGEFIAYTFVPLIFLGAYNVFWKNFKKWPQLAIGMSLLLYSHLLSVYLISMILTGLVISKIIIQRRFESERILALCKSIGLTLLLSSFIIVPFITDFIGQNLASPKKGFDLLMSFDEMIVASVSNTISINHSIGIIMLITALLGWYFVRKSIVEKNIYIIGIIFLCLSTTLVPWGLLDHSHTALNILGEIQFPYRFNTYSSFFLSITASLVLSQLLEQFKTNYLRKIAIISFVFFSIVGYYGSIQSIFDRVLAANQNYLLESKGAPIPLPINALVDKSNYNNIFSYLVLNGETDYYPKYADKDTGSYNQSIYNNYVIIGKREIKLVPKTVPNTIIYQVHKSGKEENINLPIIDYNRTQVKLNNKRVTHTKSFRGTVEVKSAQKNNKITVTYQPSKLFYFSLFISCLTWIALMIRFFVGKLKR